VSLARPASTGTPSAQIDVWRFVDQDAELTAAATMAITATAGVCAFGHKRRLALFQVPVARTDHGLLALITDIDGTFHIVSLIGFCWSLPRQDYIHGVDRRVCIAGAEPSSACAVDKRDPF